MDYNHFFAKRMENLGDSSMWIEWGNLARSNNACNLGSGFPDFPLHPYIQKELTEAASVSSNNWYTRSQGHPKLQDEIAKCSSAIFGRRVESTDVIVTIGAYQGIYWTFQLFIEEDDEVIVFNPTFDAYRMNNLMTKGKIVPVELEIKSDQWVLDRELLAQSFSNKTKMVVLNTPHNPTGKCFTREELTYIGDLCKKHNCIVMSDEVYDRYTLNNHEHVRMASLPGMWERTVSLYSAGKMFAITGWRLGWAIGPRQIIQKLHGVCLVDTFGCPTILQEVVARMLERERLLVDPKESYFNWAGSIFAENYTKLCNAFKSVNMPPVHAEGGFFLVVDCSKRSFKFQESDEYKNCNDAQDVKIAKELTKQFKILMLPLSLFYNLELKAIPTNYLRVCFAKCPQTINRAIEIIETFD